ncbi:hypothetical protein [Streptomyces sp. 7N604]|uniref:hypothetical protein n=1 Tax=Streptomyces sp. 7N604 TaxID=3457415 RepID=UPI003FD64910
MAGSLAALIRDHELIDDAQALRAVAAEQLDVNQFAFDQVIEALAEVGFIEGVQRSGGKIQRFTENVPHYDEGECAIPASTVSRGRLSGRGWPAVQ